MASLLSDLQACLGSDRVLTDAMALAPLLLDNRGRWQGRALCAVFPSTTEEVSEIMRVACRHNALVFAQGGNTGNAAAATPVVNDTDVSRTVLLSTTRLRRIEKIDTVNDSVVVQAGVPVAAVRETAALQKRLLHSALPATERLRWEAFLRPTLAAYMFCDTATPETYVWDLKSFFAMDACST